MHETLVDTFYLEACVALLPPDLVLYQMGLGFSSAFGVNLNICLQYLRVYSEGWKLFRQI